MESEYIQDSMDVDSLVDPLGNRLHRYALAGDQLINPALLLDSIVIPPNYRREHNGGKNPHRTI